MRNPLLTLTISQCEDETLAAEMATLLAFAERLGASPRELEILLASLLDGQCS